MVIFWKRLGYDKSMITSRLQKAINIAAWAHRYQKRRGGDVPYIVHPYSVMLLVQQASANEDILIAALFHDILEDVSDQYDANVMQEEFGSEVVRIVQAVSHDITITNWRQRSEAYIKQVDAAGEEAALVCVADKIHNLQNMLTDMEKEGQAVWHKFTASADEYVWWYESVLEMTQSKLGSEHSLVMHLSQLVNQLKQSIQQ